MPSTTRPGRSSTRWIDRRPALIARCAGADDVAGTIAFARYARPPPGGARRRAQRRRPGRRGRRRRLRPVAPARGRRRPGGAHGSRRRRLYLGRRRQRDTAARSRGAVRDHLDDRGRRPHARRRARTPDAEVRPLDRQPARGRHRHWPTGEQVRASADENPDLFWAIRGGGGNFGVVTSFLFRANPVGTVVAGPDVLADRAVGRGAERPTGSSCPQRRGSSPASSRSTSSRPAPPSRRSSDAPRLRRRLELPRDGGGPGEGCSRRCSRSARRSCTACTRCRSRRSTAPSTASTRAGDQWYWRADFVKEISDEAVELNAEFGEKLPTLQVDHAHVSDRRRRPRRRADGHALGLPRRPLGQVMVGVDPDPATEGRHPRNGRSTTGRRSTRTRPAART